MSNGQPCLFSVVIPTYNYGSYLPRAMESVLVQPGDDYEIIIVDDGSIDSTAELVRSYQATSKSIRYIYQDNRGPAVARNRGIEMSSGRYLLFLDADDALLLNALAAFRRVVDGPCEVDFVLAGWRMISSKGRLTEVAGKPTVSGKEDAFIGYMRGVLLLAPGSAIFHRRIFDRLRFPEALSSTEDWVLYAHILALHSGVSIVDPVVTVHRHQSSLSHNVELSKRNWPRALDLVFDPLILPPHLMAYRDECSAIMHMALFHRLYNSGEFHAALHEIEKAVAISFKYMLGWRHIRRYLWARWKVLRAARRAA
jgi:glycosyltransferase involved in cell wall biosynthesis